jgi:hypothetical protein
LGCICHSFPLTLIVGWSFLLEQWFVFHAYICQFLGNSWVWLCGMPPWRFLFLYSTVYQTLLLLFCSISVSWLLLLFSASISVMSMSISPLLMCSQIWAYFCFYLRYVS